MPPGSEQALSPPFPSRARTGRSGSVRRRALASTLRRARRLPGYERAFADAGAIDDDDPFTTLARLPPLERNEVQARPEAFTCEGTRSLSLSSSGSTGTPLRLRLGRWARLRRRGQWALFFARGGWRPWHRSLSFRVLPDDSDRLGSRWLDRSLLSRRRTLSVLEPLDRQFEALRDSDPQILHGLPSVLEPLALRAEAEGFSPADLRVVFSSSEALTPAARKLIERALGAPVLDSYGAAEALIGWECTPGGGIHVLDRNVVLEVVGDDGRPLPAGEIGRVVITTLDNPAMPLVRYAIGDMAVAPGEDRCPCGRAGPLIPRVLGRQVPLFEVSGAEVSPWGVIARMHELESVRQFQLVQEAPDELVVLVRGRSPVAPVDRAELARLVADELGPSVRVELREVERIDPLATGKAAPALVVPAREALPSA